MRFGLPWANAKRSKLIRLDAYCQQQSKVAELTKCVPLPPDSPNYMKSKCAPVCQSCDFLSIETRCPLDPNAVDALYPGDVTKVFNRIQTDPSLQQYQPKIVSRPSYLEGDTEETADYKIGPWMVVFDNAISDEEADRLIELGGIEGYERSADVGKKLADGTYDKKVCLRDDFFSCFRFPLDFQLHSLTFYKLCFRRFMLEGLVRMLGAKTNVTRTQ